MSTPYSSLYSLMNDNDIVIQFNDGSVGLVPIRKVVDHIEDREQSICVYSLDDDLEDILIFHTQTYLEDFLGDVTMIADFRVSSDTPLQGGTVYIERK